MIIGYMPVRTCECCQFSSNHKRVFDFHMKSNRHLQRASNQNQGNVQYFTCDKCPKSYTSRSGLWRHSQKCTAQPVVVPSNASNTETLAVLEQIKEMLKLQTPSQPAPPPPIQTHVDAPEYVYLLQEREFVHNGRPVYKIGKTKQSNQKRFAQYPKGSILLFQRKCHDCHQVEQQLIQRFQDQYQQKTDIGCEYFEGDPDDMIEDMCAILSQEHASFKARERSTPTGTVF